VVVFLAADQSAYITSQIWDDVPAAWGHRPPGQTTELVMGPQGVRVPRSQESARDRAAAWRKVPGGPGTGWRTGERFPRRWCPVNIGGPGA
jgi:hypothetical protein